MMGWMPSFWLEAIAIRLEANALRLEAIALRMETILLGRFEDIPIRYGGHRFLRLEANMLRYRDHSYLVGGHRY